MLIHGSLPTSDRDPMTSTLADVARAAGVDVSTVSRVLRGERTQRVRSETRDRIMKAVRDLDYRPNALARGLRLARSNTLGLVVPQLDNPVFAEAIGGAEIAAAARGYSLLISHRSTAHDSETYRRLASTNRVDGLLVASFDADQDLLGDLEGAGVPIVMINRHTPGIEYSVVHNSHKAARMATDHLLDIGHRRIAHLAGRPGGFNTSQRLSGYREALAERGVPFDDSLVLTAGYSAEGAIEATRDLLSRSGPKPTAIFAATLLTAAGAMRVLHESGIRVPEEISVVGIHDAEFASILFPPLTTVRMPNRTMGRIAAELLIDLLDGVASNRQVVLQPEELVLRASTAAPRTV